MENTTYDVEDIYMSRTIKRAVDKHSKQCGRHVYMHKTKKRHIYKDNGKKRHVKWAKQIEVILMTRNNKHHNSICPSFIKIL